MYPTLLRPEQFEDKEKLRPGDEALVLEIGGTNARASIVQVGTDRIVRVKKHGSSVVYQDKKITRTKFWDVDDFLEEVLDPVRHVIYGNYPKAIAIIYSFGGDAIVTDYGIDVVPNDRMGKEFSVPGISSKPIGQSVFEKLQRLRGVKVKINNTPLSMLGQNDVSMGVMNDTPAVSIGSKIGGVVGTGFNLAFTIDGQIYNSESAHEDGVPVNEPALYADEKSDNPGEALAEKQISGLYLASQLEYVVSKLVERGFIKQSIAGQLTSKFITDVLGLSKSKVEETFDNLIDTYSYAIFSAVVGRMRYRSAQLVGTMIGSVVKAFPDVYPAKLIHVPLEGSVFWEIPGYSKIAGKYARYINGNNKDFHFMYRENAGITGAGQAVLSLMKQS